MTFTVFGGRLGPPIELVIHGKLPVTVEQIRSNMDQARARGLPAIRKGCGLGRRLAIVGGGPSVTAHIDKLKDWDGEVWAINGAWRFLRSHGIPAVFVSIDPHPIVCDWVALKPERSVIADCCDPAVFDHLSGTDIQVFDADTIKGGSSTAGVVPHIAALMGFTDVTLFGCESSYQLDRTHAYMKEDRDEQLLVESDGAFYLTAPDFFSQAGDLAFLMKHLDGWLKEESGGLVRAAAADLKMDKTPRIFWVSEAMVANFSLEPIAPKHGEGQVTCEMTPITDWAEAEAWFRVVEPEEIPLRRAAE